MRSLTERLADGDVLVGDGAWGTMLMARGLPAGAAPETFALSRPDLIEEVARLYVEAGADLITTNTFGGTPARLADCGLGDRVAEVNRLAVEAARRAVGTAALVSGSMGPTGRMLRPYGEADPAEVAEGFFEQARALAGAGVDLFCIETMIALEEARLAVSAARRAAPGVPIVATMTFERSRRGFFTVMGDSVASVARGLAEAGADLVGSNCGNGIATMMEIARAFREVTPLPLAIQSNAGLPELVEGRLVYAETPGMFAEAVPALVAAGVRLVGGCCGTTPAHVRAVRDALRGGGAGRRQSTG